MGYYDVVKPCVVGQLHYARPTDQPIVVDDEVAAPLVESGELKPYRPGGEPEQVDGDTEPEAPTDDPPSARGGRRQRHTES